MISGFVHVSAPQQDGALPMTTSFATLPAGFHWTTEGFVAIPRFPDLPADKVDITITCGTRSQSPRTNRLYSKLNPGDKANYLDTRPHNLRPFAGAHYIRERGNALLENFNRPLATMNVVDDGDIELVILLELEAGCLGAHDLLPEDLWHDVEADYKVQETVAFEAAVAMATYINGFHHGKLPVRVIANHTSNFQPNGRATVRPYGVLTAGRLP
jgi:hypothetical protein